MVSLPLIGLALALLVGVALLEGRVISFRKFRRVSFLVQNTILENGFNSTQPLWCQMNMVVARDVTFTVDVLGNACVAPLGLLGSFSKDLVDPCVALELFFSEVQILYIFFLSGSEGEKLARTRCQWHRKVSLPIGWFDQLLQHWIERGDSRRRGRFHQWKELWARTSPFGGMNL